MTLARRPLVALMLLSLAAGSPAAPKKQPAVPVAPAACVDFYGHVNHDWLRAHPLPFGAASVSRWDELNATAAGQTAELLARSSPTSAGPASPLLASLVASAQDSAGLDAAARAVAMPLLARVNGIRKPKDIAPVIAALHAAGVPVLFGFDALRDPASGQAHATFIPAGLGLGDPAYYLAPTAEVRRATALYASYLGELLRFAGVADAQVDAQAASVLALERTLAQAMAGAASASATPAQLGKLHPSLALDRFLQAQNVSPAMLFFRQPEYFARLDAMLANKASVTQWQSYLRAHVAHSLAETMARDPRQPYLAALNATTTASGPVPAAERLPKLAQDEAFELVSLAYPENFLEPATQQRATAIAEAIRQSMGRAIDRAAWLSPEGKLAARTKLAAMTLAIGKPTTPASLEGLVLDRGSYAGNVLALRRWNRARSLARLAGANWPAPVSQAQPLIGYQAAENRLIVTAAALRAPVLDGTSPAADYGSFGALVGQQMSLGFADFTEADGRALAARQGGLVTQYAAYAAAPTIMVDGVRTQRQNAADLAGVELAWDALNAQAPADAIATKAFSRAWAALWARQDSPAALLAAQSGSTFAPARWRANGPLANLPGFAKAHACKAGQPMVRADKDQLAIWR